MKYSEYNLELRRENGYIRLYNDNNKAFRVYNGMSMIYSGDDHGAAYRAYNEVII